MSTGIPKDRSEAYSVTGDVIAATLKIGITVFVVATIGFSLIHRFKLVDEIYSARSYLYPSLTPNVHPKVSRHKQRIKQKSKPPDKSRNKNNCGSKSNNLQYSPLGEIDQELPLRYLFSWIVDLFQVKEDTILRTVGLDALVFIRMQRMCFFVFLICSIFGIGILLPTYWTFAVKSTHKHHNMDAKNVDFFPRTTAGALPQNSDENDYSKIYRTMVAMAYIYTTVTIYFIYIEYKHFMKLRFKWLSLPRAHNYSIMVSHVPKKMRDTEKLKNFFNGILNPSSRMHHTKYLHSLLNNTQSIEGIKSMESIESIGIIERKEEKKKEEEKMGEVENSNEEVDDDDIEQQQQEQKQQKKQKEDTEDKEKKKEKEQIEVMTFNHNDHNNNNSNNNILHSHNAHINRKKCNNYDYRGLAHVVNVTMVMDVPQLKQLVKERNSVYETLEYTMYLYDLGEPRWCDIYNKIRYKDKDDLYLEDLSQKIALYGERLQIMNEVIQYLQEYIRKVLYQHDVEGYHEKALKDNNNINNNMNSIKNNVNEIKSQNDYISSFSSSIDVTSSYYYSLQQLLHEKEKDAKKGFEGGKGETKENKYGSFDEIQTNPLLFQKQNRQQRQQQQQQQQQPQQQQEQQPQQQQQQQQQLQHIITIDRNRYANNDSNYNNFVNNNNNNNNNNNQLSSQSVHILTQLLQEPPFSNKNSNKKSDKKKSTNKTFDYADTIFLTLNSLQATSFLRQSYIFDSAFKLHVSAAPAPEDIIWSNINRGHVVGYIQYSLSLAVTILLTIFFALPVSIISAMNSYNSIMNFFATHTHISPYTNQALHEINRWFAAHEEWKTRVDYLLPFLSPLLLLGLLSLVPVILSLVMRSIFRDARTVSECDSLLFSRYYLFLFYNAFLVYIITSSVMENLAGASVSEVIKNIGATLPKPAAFYLKFILIKGLMGLPLELVRSSSYLLWFLKLLFINDLTLSNRAKTVIGLRSIYHPGSFPYGKLLSEHMLVFLLVLSYAAIAPVILLSGVVFFLLSYIVYKRQLLYVYEPEYDNGGKIFLSLVHYYFYALFVSQVLLLCLLVTKLAYNQVAWLVLLPVVTIGAARILYTSFGKCCCELPINIAYRCDAINNNYNNRNIKKTIDERDQEMGKGREMEKGEEEEIEIEIEIERQQQQQQDTCVEDTFTTTSRFRQYSSQKEKYNSVYRFEEQQQQLEHQQQQLLLSLQQEQQQEEGGGGGEEEEEMETEKEAERDTERNVINNVDLDVSQRPIHTIHERQNNKKNKNSNSRKKNSSFHRRRNTLDSLPSLYLFSRQQQEHLFPVSSSSSSSSLYSYHHPVLRSPWLMPPGNLERYRMDRGDKIGRIDRIDRKDKIDRRDGKDENDGERESLQIQNHI